MNASSYFDDFLTDIRPTEKQRKALRKGHITLRERLTQHEPLKPAIITTFLQGSYRRSTAVRPTPGRRSDVDIIVVTRLDESEYTPSAALELFRSFMREHYKNEYRFQGRSIGVSQEHVDLDLVITSAPPESVIGILPDEDDEGLEEEAPRQRAKSAASASAWKEQPLRIPNREVARWVDTHPLAQLQWTREKNASTNGHFVNVVKALKWWKYNQYPGIDNPKSYPLERIVAECCPDSITSVAEGVTKTLEAILTRFGDGKPVLHDHGCHPDVLLRLTPEDFHKFYGLVAAAAKLARSAFDADDLEESAGLWRDLFGDSFPKPPAVGDRGGGGGDKGGFSPRTEGPSVPVSGRFA